MRKQVYAFGGTMTEGDAKMVELLGGKGANLAEMSALGLPVPPGFTITTEVCHEYYRQKNGYSDRIKKEVSNALLELERKTEKQFGNPQNPLLVSVRSGAPASMPGMMDTVLNLGLNDQTAEGLIELTNNPRFVYDSYRRFIQMYADVVLGVDHNVFEEILDDYKEQKKYIYDTDLKTEDLKILVDTYKFAVEEHLERAFPQDPVEQLWGAIEAVFSSWTNSRAVLYRKLNDIPENWGTAVNVQSMVFGNMGETSATGVAFTRNPSTGDKSYYGEFLINAQGEDVVAGIRTPQPLTISMRKDMDSVHPSMEEAMPEIYQELTNVFKRLEMHYRDMQDIEFTVEKGHLWMLQTRSGKRTAKAALKTAIDMAREKMITKEEAVLRIDPLSLDQLLHPTLDPKAEKKIIAKGLPASPGAGYGKIVLNADKAEKLAQKGEKVILVRTETSPEDIHGMHASEAIITARGGMTSHAAVVARGMGKPCVSGVSTLSIYPEEKKISVGNLTIKEGDFISVDGANGEIILGKVSMIQPKLSEDFSLLMKWADQVRRMKVRTNAEVPQDVKIAKSFGAEGIGLCRTEHMFFESDRIEVVREMILSETLDARKSALKKLLPFQKQDFIKIFEIMQDLPCTIRLLDPPLHEFLPHKEEDVINISKATGISTRKLMKKADSLKESNPMLGHRGCRLGVTYPEIYEMQVRAIFEAQHYVSERNGYQIQPEIMIPLAITRQELAFLKEKIQIIAKEVEQRMGKKTTYLLGAMVELPRAALSADELAKEVSFFSFGTNDLTQTCFGLSRDDVGQFMPDYLEKNIFEKDPFVTLDRKSVGGLVKMAVENGKQTRPNIKLGICGEHGGDPNSIEFCEQIGLDYISCSPYRVPIARLAAAQAVLKNRNKRAS